MLLINVGIFYIGSNACDNIFQDCHVIFKIQVINLTDVKSSELAFMIDECKLPPNTSILISVAAEGSDVTHRNRSSFIAAIWNCQDTLPETTRTIWILEQFWRNNYEIDVKQKIILCT